MSEPTELQGRKIVLLSDGTGNSAGKLFKTNVWRLYQALDLSNVNQIAFYDDGVGTSSLKPLALLGGAVGWGLKRNVLDLYVFLCRNYRPGDRIYAFGFSRGAFTIRVLLRLVLSQGLIQNKYSNVSMRRRAVRLYRALRRDETRPAGLHTPLRWLRDRAVALMDRIFRPNEPPTERQYVSGVEFLGLWDTVDAYGLPIETFERGIDRWVWPLTFDDTELHSEIKKACHALSIDDRRKAFHPLLWNEPEEVVRDEGHTDNERLTQVWFAGMHANVGGGYPDDSLSSVTLRWMIHEAQKHGLSFNPITLVELDGKIAPYGPIYDSRSGLGGYYQYTPRPLAPACDRLGAKIHALKVHETAIWRMAAGSDAYAPLNLPAHFRVVTGPETAAWSDAGVDPMTGAKPIPKPNIMTYERYCAAVRSPASHLYGAPAGRDAKADARERVVNEFGTLLPPEPDRLELVQGTIWWRRLVYYLTVAVTLLLIAALVRPALIELLPYNRSDADRAVAPFVKSFFTLAGLFVPNGLQGWLTPFKSHPVFMFGLLMVVMLCFVWGNRLDRLLQDRALRAWNTRWRKDTWQTFEAAVRVRRHAAIAVLAACAAASALIFWGAGSDFWNWWNLSAALCMSQLECEQKNVSRFIRLILVWLPLCVLALATTGAVLRWLANLNRRAAEARREHREVLAISIAFARWLQKSLWVEKFNRLLFAHVIPVTFAAVIFVSALASANRAVFTAVSAAGGVCEPAKKHVESTHYLFDLKHNQICFASTMMLKPDRSYEILIVPDVVADMPGPALATTSATVPTPFYPGTAPPETPQETATTIGVVSAGPSLRRAQLPSGAPPALPRFFETLISDVAWVWRWPLLRKLSQPWQAVIVQVGRYENEHHYLNGGKLEIKPGKDGELFVFVNDAVLGVPLAYGALYNSNKTTQLMVRSVARGTGDSIETPEEQLRRLSPDR